MFERFTNGARKVVVLCQEEARMLNHNYIGTEHILLGLIREGEGVAIKALELLGISLEAVRQQVEEIIGQGKQSPSGHIPFTPRAKKVLELSLREALHLGDNHIGTEHILLGLIREGDGVASQVLVKLGADLDRTRRQVMHLHYVYSSKGPQALSPKPEPSTSAVLDQFGRNLTHAAWEGRLDPVIGREKEAERVMQVLSRRISINPMLLGESGVGKNAVVELIAQTIVYGQVPQNIATKLVYSIDIGTLVSVVSGQDDLKAQLQAAVKEAGVRGDIILFLDGLRLLTSDGWMILNPMFSRGELQIIGALTPDEFRALLGANPVLQRTFAPIQVAEPTVEHTIEILRALRDRYEAHHGVSISDAALASAAALASQRLAGKRLPGKAVDLMDEAAALCRMRNQPPDLREYNEKIAEVRKDKESKIDGQDVVKTAALRETEEQLLTQKAALVREWKAAAVVDEELISETLSIMLGLSSDGAGDVGQVPAAPKPRFAPAAMTDDDREIWAMS
jgi:ATP-dependent Clp protease ATP-binding subunit ClpC